MIQLNPIIAPPSPPVVLRSNIPSHSLEITTKNDVPNGMMKANLPGLSASNCWVSSSIALLANDPLIAAFVDFACCQHGMRIPTGDSFPELHVKFVAKKNHIGRICNPAFDEEEKIEWQEVEDELASNKQLLVRSLIRNIWYINNGDANQIESRTKQSIQLFRLTYATGAQIPADGFAGFVDAFYFYKEIIKAAMVAWWNKESAELYVNYGDRIQAKSMYFDLHSSATYIGDASESIRNAVEITVTGREIVHLENVINHRFFNHAEICDHRSHKRELVSLNPEIKASAFIRCIDTLPLRFCINIHRLNYDNMLRPTSFNNTPVIYNPRSFILGPTLGDNLHARYRLVGRIIHSGTLHGEAHYTANILHPKRRNDLYDPKTVNTKPDDMLFYNWNAVKAEEFRNHDATTGMVSDRYGVLLEFEKYQG